VRKAWNFNRINRIQEHYILHANENLALLERSSATPSELMQLLRMENQAYSQAMSIDPLLPEELHPKDYAGKRVFEIRRRLIKRIIEHL